MKEALLIVDLQNDFMPGGALGVKGGGEIRDTDHLAKSRMTGRVRRNVSPGPEMCSRHSQ